MPLPLKHSRAISDMASLLYNFLPGSGNPKWKGHVSFKTVAQKVGVGDFWQIGSKRPMIIALLSKTLELRRDRFEALMLEIVRAGLVYRQSQGNPVKAGEVENLNGLILEVGFKFPDLWDPELKASLLMDGTIRARSHVKREQSRENLRTDQVRERSNEMHTLAEQFFAMHSEPNRQKAGLQFEKILNRMFELNQLSPRASFRVLGEQIDGSFVLDSEVYLLEAKWEQEPLSEADLLVFRGKIEGKSKYTRGAFISVNGITKECENAITRGKQPSFFVMNGYDITMLLQEEMSLIDFLRQRQRILAEEGRITVPFHEIQFKS